MTAKVEQKHREAAARAMQPDVDETWWIWHWVKTGAVPSSHEKWVGFEQTARVAQALADAEYPAPSSEGGFDPVMLEQVIRWLYGRGHKSAAIDLDCNWNDGPPGDGSCRKIREMVGLTSADQAKGDKSP